LVLVGVPVAARADFIPWSYRNPTNETVFTPDAGAGLSFPNGDFVARGGPGRIMVSPIVSWSSAPADSPDAIRNEPYSFAFEIRDDASGAVKALSFAGILDGSIWQTGSNLTNRFVGPTTQSFDLGANRYAVTLTGFDSPDGYGVGASGALLGSVTVQALPTGEPPTATPEPGTLALAAIGLPLAGLARAVVRRRKG
jgi:hypothetical protein